MVAGLETSHKVGILVVAGIYIAYALLSSFVFPAMSPNFPGKRVGLFTVVSALLTVAMLGTIIALAKEPAETAEHAAVVESTPDAPEPGPPPATSTAETTTEAEAGAGAGDGNAASGKAVFVTAGCGGCHAMKAANSTGNIGPNLDDTSSSADKVVERVTEGRGVMPSFAGQLSPQQIQDVAAYVESVTG